jgi:hypothetical protein
MLHTGPWFELSDEQWHNLQKSNVYWSVKEENGILVTKDSSNMVGRVYYEKTDTADGFFLQINDFERSGGLYFYPNGNIEKKYLVYSGSFTGIYSVNNMYYAFVTVPAIHQYNNELLEIKKELFKWKAKVIESIEDIPYCFVKADERTLYLITDARIIEYKDNKFSRIITENALWERLWPTSVICYEGSLYMGLLG